MYKRIFLTDCLALGVNTHYLPPFPYYDTTVRLDGGDCHTVYQLGPLFLTHYHNRSWGSPTQWSYNMLELEHLEYILEKSVKKHGEIPLTNKHLLNIVRMAMKKYREQEFYDDLEGDVPF